MFSLGAQETVVSYIIFQFFMPQVQCQKSDIKVIGFHIPYLPLGHLLTPKNI